MRGGRTRITVRRTLTEPKTALAGVMLEISLAIFRISMATLSAEIEPSLPRCWDAVPIVKVRGSCKRGGGDAWAVRENTTNMSGNFVMTGPAILCKNCILHDESKQHVIRLFLRTALLSLPWHIFAADVNVLAMPEVRFSRGDPSLLDSRYSRTRTVREFKDEDSGGEKGDKKLWGKMKRIVNDVHRISWYFGFSLGSSLTWEECSIRMEGVQEPPG